MLRKPTYSAAFKGGRFPTVEGHFIDVRVGDEGEVTVNDAKVTDVDISASDGIIHAIDKVLMPVSGDWLFVLVSSKCSSFRSFGLIPSSTM